MLPIKPKIILKLDELWDRYTEYNAQLIEQTIIKTNYKRIKNTMALFPSKNIEDAVAIRDWLLANKSAYTAKVIWSHLSGCCSWGVESKLIDTNPFKEMATKVKASNSKKPEDIDPFTVSERNAIIEAFQNDRSSSHSTKFVRFLFMTGCLLVRRSPSNGN